jgi:hypothetical protein
MREAIRRNQTPSDAIIGGQAHLMKHPIRGHSGHHMLITYTIIPSTSCAEHSSSIKCTQVHSSAIKCNQVQSSVP